MHIRQEISKEKTYTLGIPDLLVLENEGDDENFYTVHKRYFLKEKVKCPACGSTKTRCSKVIKRTFKDIIYNSDGSFKTINLFFYQRYLRCDGCRDSVFPEEVDFAEKSCRYTNRLSDKLAEGTFTNSYQKVCNNYGVPASTASVGAIMRRRIEQMERLFLPLKPPDVICITEAAFHSNVYPIVFSLRGTELHLIDILPDTSEESYLTYFRTLPLEKVSAIYIDPSEALKNAALQVLPNANLVVSDECILRYANSSMRDIIRRDGKWFPINHKYDRLTTNNKFATDAYVRQRINEGLEKRPRLKAAYQSHQGLLKIMNERWSYDDVFAWAQRIPKDLVEFSDVSTLIEYYETEIRSFVEQHTKSPKGYILSVQNFYDALKDMPHCIYEVLRARCMFTVQHDTIEENGKKLRLGVPINTIIEKMNKISCDIKEEREYGL